MKLVEIAVLRANKDALLGDREEDMLNRQILFDEIQYDEMFGHTREEWVAKSHEWNQDMVMLQVAYSPVEVTKDNVPKRIFCLTEAFDPDRSRLEAEAAGIEVNPLIQLLLMMMAGEDAIKEIIPEEFKPVVDRMEAMGDRMVGVARQMDFTRFITPVTLEDYVDRYVGFNIDVNVDDPWASFGFESFEKYYEYIDSAYLYDTCVFLAMLTNSLEPLDKIDFNEIIRCVPTYQRTGDQIKSMVLEDPELRELASVDLPLQGYCSKFPQLATAIRRVNDWTIDEY